jgi:hypothetical protein
VAYTSYILLIFGCEPNHLFNCISMLVNIAITIFTDKSPWTGLGKRAVVWVICGLDTS